MSALKNKTKLVIVVSLALLVLVGYFLLALYQDFRVLFSSKSPKILTMKGEDLQCRVDDRRSSNPNKLLFVSCSGFYDE